MKSICFFVLAAIPVGAQSQPAKMEFEVASIKPSPPLFARANIGVHIDGAQVSCTYLSLRDYISAAYHVKDYQISAPDWAASTRFDIHAKLPAGAIRAQVPDMIQSLLADRFHLELHHESRQFPVYALVVAKGGLKMKEAEPDPDAPAPAEAAKAPVNVTATGGKEGTSVSFGHGSYFNVSENRFEAKKITMTALAEMLARFVDRPVVDMTEVKGIYDISMPVSQEDFRAMMVRAAMSAGVILPPEAMRALDTSSLDSLGAALASVGLKLDARKEPLDVLVVDHIEKTPTEN